MPRSERNPSPGGEAAVCAAFLLASVLLFLPVLSTPPAFLCDDYTILSTLVKDGRLDPGRMADHFAHTFHGLSGRYYRPVFYLSYALDFLAAGAHPAFFVLMNALYHGLAAWFLFRLLRRIGAGGALASAAGMIFLCHPIHVEAVAWIAGRTSSLAGMLYLGALAAFAGYRRKPGICSLAALVCFAALGMLTREEGIVLPLLLAAVDLSTRGNGEGEGRRPRGLSFFLPYGAVLILGAGYWVARTEVLGAGASTAGEVLAGLFHPARWTDILSSLARYMIPLSAAVPGGGSTGLRIAMAAVFAGLFLIGLTALRDRSGRRVWFLGAAFFVVAGLPSLPVLHVDENLLNARCFYFPSAGMAVLLAAGAVPMLVRGVRGKGLFGAVLAGSVFLLVLNQGPFRAAFREARAFLRAARTAGYDVLVVPRLEYFPYADREGDGVLDDREAVFAPLSAEPPSPTSASSGHRVAILIDVPRLRGGVYLFWGGLDRALLPLFGRPGVDVLFTEMYTDKEPNLAPEGSFMGPLVGDGIPVLKWMGRRLVPVEPEELGTGSPAGREIRTARAVPSLGPARSLNGYTFPGAAFKPRIALPAKGAEGGEYRYRILSPFGTRRLPAAPRRDGERLLFDPWNEEGAGALLKAAAHLVEEGPPGGRKLYDFSRLSLILYIERVVAGVVRGRSTPLCFRLRFHDGA